jgi:hypothetical protein
MLHGFDLRVTFGHGTGGYNSVVKLQG